MQPSHNDDVVAGREGIKAVCYQGIHFKPCVESSLRALFGRFAALFEAR
jgi:hypothetical protein